MELPIRKKMRLDQYDYSLPNAYFITFCTHNRENFFGSPRSGTLELSDIGKLIDREIQKIDTVYSSVHVDKYCIMPNHIHMILVIDTKDDGRTQFAPTVSRIVKQFKGAVTKQIGFSVWQKEFHDHIIRGENDYLKIWNYIESNPSRWLEDELYQP